MAGNPGAPPLTVMDSSAPSRRPRIGLTTWRRRVDTILGNEALYTLAEEYVEGVRRAGGLPVVLPPASLAAAGELVGALDGLILTGGGDISPSCYTDDDEGVSSDIDHEEDAWNVALVHAAREHDLPVLGICRGLQALNVALGGTLHQDIAGRANHPRVPADPEATVAFRHPVVLDHGSRLARSLGAGERSVNSIHHQAVDRLGEGLAVVGRAPDGTVEAVEYRGENPRWWAHAVQWHPERLPGGANQALFDDFVCAAADRSLATGP